MSTKTRFEKEAWGNSEMAYLIFAVKQFVYLYLYTILYA